MRIIQLIKEAFLGYGSTYGVYTAMRTSEIERTERQKEIVKMIKEKINKRT